MYTGEAGTVLNLRRPSDAEAASFIGMIVAVFRISDFSDFVASLETESGQNAFILYDRNYVLAHTAHSRAAFQASDRADRCPR